MARVESVPFVTPQDGVFVVYVRRCVWKVQQAKEVKDFSHILGGGGGAFICWVGHKYYCQRAEEKRILQNADTPCLDGLSKAIY